MLGKHFALLGSTGTGKSTSAALILHRISQLAPEGHIVMIDPHGEYSAAFKGCGELFNVDNLQLPYWLMNFEEHCEVLLTTQGAERQRDADILAKCLLAARTKGKDMSQYRQGHRRLPDPLPADRPQRDPSSTRWASSTAPATRCPFQRLKTKLDELQRRSALHLHVLRHAGVGFDGRLHRQALPPAEPRPADLDRRRLGRSVRHHLGRGRRCLPRMVFDYAIWSRTEAQRPLLLVCEEAHRYVPKDENATGQAVRKILERIAKEGRKYGVSLGLITQRPSDLAEGVLSQCGTIISMRLNNDRDQACVRAAMPEGARGFLDAIPALRNRECIVCGEGVAIPIRVRFDDLEPEKRPASSDPSFARLWRETGDEAGIIQRTIKRWRGHGR